MRRLLICRTTTPLAWSCAMDEEECYRWGELFISDWGSLVSGMSARANTMGLIQEERDGILIWRKGADEQCRWVFVEDPSDLETVRAVYSSDENTNSPSCFVVVRQRDPSDSRGDVIFDIFGLSPESYLWHFNRVYTPPKKSG
jgi:hypothetical protein